jgi:hypothetical protein
MQSYVPLELIHWYWDGQVPAKSGDPFATMSRVDFRASPWRTAFGPVLLTTVGRWVNLHQHRHASHPTRVRPASLEQAFLRNSAVRVGQSTNDGRAAA